ADADVFNGAEGNTKRPSWRGRGGPPESSGRGMQEQMRWRTQEAPKGSCRGDGIGMIYSY
ncbi:MAG: hypothetical protein P8Y25_15030, partial [Chromatiaceae bacterium]